jgi:hypothetical protein
LNPCGARIQPRRKWSEFTVALRVVGTSEKPSF